MDGNASSKEKTSALLIDGFMGNSFKTIPA
jgi:hypothetical protein